MLRLTYDELLKNTDVDYSICEQFLNLFSSETFSYEEFIVNKTYSLGSIEVGGDLPTTATTAELQNILIEFTAHLIINCDGNLQKSNNLTKIILQKVDMLHIKGFMSSLIDFLIFTIENEVLAQDTYYFINKEKSLFVLASFLDSPPQNMLALLKPLCENRNNAGKLSGKIIKDKSIIYQKREGPEFSINFTNKCPCACVFCVRDFSRGWKGDTNLYLSEEPTIADIKEAVARELERRTDTVELIKFCGYGEPLVRPDVVVEVAMFIKILMPNVKIQINTAGWPYYRNPIVSLEEYKLAGITSFSVSINAPNKERYNIITRPGVYDVDNAAFDDTLRFIKECLHHGFETKCTLVNNILKDFEISDTEKIVNELGAVFIVRNYIGDIDKDRTDKKTTEIEAKVLGVNRDELLQKFKSKRIGLKYAGITNLLVYDVPSDSKKWEAVLSLIKDNPPELRQYHGMLSVIKQAIEQGVSLKDSKTFLRIRCENGITSLILKKPEVFTENLKFESEYFYPLENIDEGMKVMDLIGMEKIREQEKFRESYAHYGVKFNVDTWPGLPTYLEVEAIDEIDIYNGLKALEIDFKNAIGLHAETLFVSNNLDSSKLFFTDEDKVYLRKPYNGLV